MKLLYGSKKATMTALAPAVVTAVVALFVATLNSLGVPEETVTAFSELLLWLLGGGAVAFNIGQGLADFGKSYEPGQIWRVLVSSTVVTAFVGLVIAILVGVFPNIPPDQVSNIQEGLLYVITLILGAFGIGQGIAQFGTERS